LNQQCRRGFSRMRNSLLVFMSLSVLAVGSAAVPAGSPIAINDKQIAELITQLGSAKYKEREAATQTLAAIGGPALEALQRAACSNDPEVGRRAQNLAHILRKRLETACFLTPLPVHLVYKNTPVLQAADDFARKTKFSIEIIGSKARLAERKITLDTGETSFWDAFNQFCEKAGLLDRVPGADSDLSSRRPLEARLGARGIVQIVELPSSDLGSVRTWDGRLLLVDGRRPPLPTCNTGAVRIRALPVKGAVPDTLKDEGLFLVEVTPQPKTAWYNVVDLRIEKALDENGQDLACSLDTRSDLSRIAVMGSGASVWDAQTGQPLPTCRDIPVRLKSGDKPTGVLREVRGVVAALVQTQEQPLITVDNILKSAGRTCLGDEGESLRLMEVDRKPEGDVNLRLELADASSANAFWAMRGGVMRPGRFRRGLVVMDNLPPANLILQDSAGKTLPLRSREEATAFTGNTLARVIALGFHAGLSEPSKLIYSGRRTIIIEIPFTLKNVPLP
jgi:hypothetical protein